jgi:hypothetical protein
MARHRFSSFGDLSGVSALEQRNYFRAMLILGVPGRGHQWN